jgi:predicted small lipoprotein YifL
MKSTLRTLVALMAAATLLTACGKKDAATETPQAPASLDPAQIKANAEKAAEASRVAALPQPNPATPAGSYLTIDSGHQLMYLYYGISKLPLDTEKVASLISNDFRSTQDQFKRQDLLKVLEPRIKADVEKAAANRYFIWEASGNLVEHYDFKDKKFPLKEGFWKGTGESYWSDNYEYKVSFNGDEKLRSFPVADEAVARQIEDMLTKFQPMKMRIYAFAQDVDMNSHVVKSRTVKLELLDAKGNVLTTTSL